MRFMGLVVGACALAGCDRAAGDEAGQVADLIAFDGADFSNDADEIAHGERIARLFSCNSCHTPDYTGANFGAFIPLVEGLWATNISRTMPEMDDRELEQVLREGRRDDRPLYLMPSKQTHFLSAPDMAALIAYLRTIEPAGERTPEPPEGFADAVAARLPDDYWRVQEFGRGFYPTAADEVDFYVERRVPDLGPELARGRYFATTVCSTCHGAALDGYGENSGDVQAVLSYDAEAFDALLTADMTLDGPLPPNEWGGSHGPYPLTEPERADIFAYATALAKSRKDKGDD